MWDPVKYLSINKYSVTRCVYMQVFPHSLMTVKRAQCSWWNSSAERVFFSDTQMRAQPTEHNVAVCIAITPLY